MTGACTIDRWAQQFAGGRVVRQLCQAQRRLDRAVVMAPQPGCRVEAVLGEQLPAVLGEQVDRIEEVVEHGLGDEVVEADAGPARLDAFATMCDLVFELV